MKHNKLNHTLLYISFGLYLALLIWVIMFKCGNPRAILGGEYSKDPIGFGPAIQEYMLLNLKERFIYDFVGREYNWYVVLKDIPINVALFLPMGIYLGLIVKDKKLLKITLIAFLVSLFFELYQLFTAFGSFNITDLVCNTLGGLLGVLIYMLLMKLINPNVVWKVVNIINIVVICVATPILIFALVYLGMNFDCVIYRYSHISY